jgi:predicted secreted protein
MQADFGAVSNVGAVTHDVAAHSKPVKPKNVKRKSVDLHGMNNPKFNPKLLEILNSNQEELIEEPNEAINQPTSQSHQIQHKRPQPVEHNIQQIRNQNNQQVLSQQKQIQQIQQATHLQQPSSVPQTPQTPQSSVLKPSTPAQSPVEPVIQHHFNVSHNLVSYKLLRAY